MSKNEENDTAVEIRQEILSHREEISKLEVMLQQEEQKKVDRQRIFEMCSKGKTMNNEALGQLSKDVLFWNDLIIFLADNNFITVDRILNLPPYTIRKATVADMLGLFKKDEPIESKNDEEGGN